MLTNFFKENLNKSLIVIDSAFPQKEPLGFRNTEVTEYLKRLQNFQAYTMYPMYPDSKAWFTHGYGMTKTEFSGNKLGYLKYHPEYSGRIKYIRKRRKYQIGLAYTYFLAETYVLLPFFEANGIPFVFTLYPGGAFGLNFEKSDRMLRSIFGSTLFRGVIVTQEITRSYLINKNLCPSHKISYIYGGFSQFSKMDVLKKKYFKQGKKSFDICFIASKYSDKGIDKGYDLFIETAKILSRLSKDIMFHVVGGFNQNDIDVSDIKGRINFYGFRKPDYLRYLYSGMDIALSPNRPYKLYEGNFDGFPLNIDAGYCGVAMFASDPLGINSFYKDGRDIIIVPLSAQSISEKVMRYYNNPKGLYKMSGNGQKITQRLFDVDYQIDSRFKFLDNFIDLAKVKVEN